MSQSTISLTEKVRLGFPWKCQ